MRVTAAQHVSAMLTSKQSPRGEAGYQTLYYTRDSLTQDEVSVIERLVQYSSARESRPKWQSYRLSGRRHVVTRIVPIPERDEADRGGRYLTHSLICDVPGGEPPFDAAVLSLLREQNFLSSLGDALASEGMKTGSVPTVTLDLSSESGRAAQARLHDWPGEQLNLLYMLMSDPSRLTEQGQHVVLLGSDEEILDALKVAFLLAPPFALKFCSFDTNPSGGTSPPEGPFWGQGAASAAGAAYVIDAMQRQVSVLESSPLRENGFSPERLSSPIRKAVAARLNHPPEPLLRCLLARQYGVFVGESVYHALLRETESPLPPSDLELLLPLGRAHRGLSLLLALEAGDDAKRLRELAALPAPSYRELAGCLRTRPGFRPWQVFVPIFIPIWFELFRREYRLDDLTTAVTIVAEHGSESDLGYVEELHEHLDADERRALGDWLKASPLRLPRLQAGLDSPVRRGAGGGHVGKSLRLLRRIGFGK